MAVREGVQSFRGDRVGTIIWTDLANGDTGAGVVVGDFGRMTVQAAGTFGVGGSMTLEGSNDGTNWATLTDEQGSDIILTDTTIASVGMFPLFVRPNINAGDGTTDLTVTLAGQRREP